jgi:hypothetical protein
VSKLGPVLVLILTRASVATGDCPREWQAGFNMPGVYARSAVVFDDGTGPALYVGGSVDARCPVSKWDGVQWTGVGLWSSEWAYIVEPEALAVFDDGRQAVTAATLSAAERGRPEAGVVMRSFPSPIT